MLLVTNGVATFDYRFEDPITASRLIVTTPDNIELTFFQSTLSNDDLSLNSVRIFYENVSEQLILSYSQDLSDLKISIYHLNGQRVFEKDFENNNGPAGIDVSKMSSGLYIAVLRNENKLRSFKFIKE